MLRVPSLHVVALAALAALAGPGCSIPLVDFQGRLAEDCAVPGDEDGNGLADCDDDACAALAACQPGVCGNGLTERGEQCDDRVETAGCNADCTLARCGDGKLNRAAGEEVDPPMSPSSAVPAATCRFDFTAVSQIYCAGTCGAWGGGNGCQQADADALCKLRLGRATAIATSYTVAAAAPMPGVCCPDINSMALGCVKVGSFDVRGVAHTVWVHDTSLMAAYGPAATIAVVSCTP